MEEKKYSGRFPFQNYSLQADLQLQNQAPFREPTVDSQKNNKILSTFCHR